MTTKPKPAIGQIWTIPKSLTWPLCRRLQIVSYDDDIRMWRVKEKGRGWISGITQQAFESADWLIFADWAPGFGPTAVAPVDLSRFPHKCPACGAPAYIGLKDVDCSSATCSKR